MPGSITRGVDKLFEYELNRNKEDIDEISGAAAGADEYSSRHQMVICEAQAYGIGYRRKNRG